MRKFTTGTLSSGLLCVIMVLSVFFATGVFAANDEADTGAVVSTAAAATDEIGVEYFGHVENKGDVPYVTGPNALGTRGQGLRIEGFGFKLTGAVPEGAKIVYQVHVQNVGWMTPVSDGDFAGTRGASQRVESIKISLENLPGYTVYYHGHVQNIANIPQVDGDWGWVKNGEELGTTGQSLRLEEIEVKIVKTTDLTAYNAALAAVKEADYTPASWTAYQVVVAANVVTMADNQTKVDAATKAITDAQAKLIKVGDVDESKVYDKAGTYGPATGVDEINGDATINVSGVTLRNLHITGDLTIGEGVGTGDVILNNITVDGDTFIRGGGTNSIHINGGEYNKITVQQTSSGQVRIVATNAAGLEIVISEAAEGQDIILEGAFDKVQIDAPDVKVSTQGDTTIQEMNIGDTATGSEINLDEQTTVEKLDINAGVDMKGEGTVKDAVINSNDVTFEQAPDNQTVEPGVTPPVVTPPTPGGGGGTDYQALALAAVNAATNAAMMQTALGGSNASYLGLDLTNYTPLDSARKTAVAADMFANKTRLSGFDSVTEVSSVFGQLAEARSVIEDSLDTVNSKNSGDPTTSDDIAFIQNIIDDLAALPDKTITLSGYSAQILLTDLNSAVAKYNALSTDLKRQQLLDGLYDQADYTSLSEMLTELYAQYLHVKSI